MLFFYLLIVRHRRNLENLDPYQEFHIKSDVLNWEEQNTEDFVRDNLYIQEPKVKDESLKDESTKSPIDKLPKPSPRYGHAACRYDGQLYIHSKY